MYPNAHTQDNKCHDISNVFNKSLFSKVDLRNVVFSCLRITLTNLRSIINEEIKDTREHIEELKSKNREKDRREYLMTMWLHTLEKAVFDAMLVMGGWPRDCEETERID